MAVLTTATTTVPDVGLDEVTATLRRFGFHDHAVEADRRTMTKPGNRSALRGHQRPLAAELRTGPDGVEIELRYDQWVALDTGDLARHLERITAAVGG